MKTFLILTMYPTREELQKRYAGFTNEKLIAMMHQQDQYTPEALEVAKAEISTRNITNVEVKEFTDAVETEKVYSKIAALTPLTFIQKAFYFFLWFAPIVLFATRLNYSEDGHLLKLKQSRFFAWAGFVSVIVNFLVMDIWLALPTIWAWVSWGVLFFAAYRLEQVIDYGIEKQFESER